MPFIACLNNVKTTHTLKTSSAHTTKEHTTHPPIKEMSSYKHDDTPDANTRHIIIHTFTTTNNPHTNV